MKSLKSGGRVNWNDWSKFNSSKVSPFRSKVNEQSKSLYLI